jgi:hydroxymethylpyrimidine pyrophosphatase-like HAD family hydrolase
MAEPPKISLVLADVDGTLVTEDKVLTKRAQAAVQHLHDVGILFAITSGRPPKGMAMLFDDLELDTPIAGFNGGLFVRRDLSIIAQKTLPADVAATAIELIRGHGLDAWIYRGNDWLITKSGAPHVAREAWTVKFQPKVVADFAGQLDDVAKLVGVSDDQIRSSAARPTPRPRSVSARRRAGRNPTTSTSPTRTRTKGRWSSISRVFWTCRPARSPPSAINRTTC